MFIQHKKVRGMNWGGAAISNAVWEGPRLRDVLLSVGFSEDKYPNIKHVCIDGMYQSSPPVNSGHYIRIGLAV